MDVIDLYMHEIKVGVGCLIVKDNMVLLGHRLASHGAGLWAGTGGHLEYGETLEECLRRETKEEADLELTNIKFLCVNDIMDYWPKQYVDIGFAAEIAHGTPKVMEPTKLKEWKWFTPQDALQLELFPTVEQYIRTYFNLSDANEHSSDTTIEIAGVRMTWTGQELAMFTKDIDKAYVAYVEYCKRLNFAPGPKENLIVHGDYVIEIDKYISSLLSFKQRSLKNDS